ncbi:MAG: hypothetical protein PHQ66_01160 [Candidatus Nanoarchaeia archaeon]|nr:hypothetical protein [Candidatus Nanoarchaeia archaeon]MDD5358013.1 hypothetical protein [Candidatus Nanoarchaeia archaeon]MDD5588932.1 hypothetical protein [Candidatus Nanoarchaeia archaeon]
MKIKKLLIILILILLVWGFVRFVLGGDEDTWIRDAQGFLIKHGNPD